MQAGDIFITAALESSVRSCCARTDRRPERPIYLEQSGFLAAPNHPTRFSEQERLFFLLGDQQAAASAGLIDDADLFSDERSARAFESHSVKALLT